MAGSHQINSDPAEEEGQTNTGIIYIYPKELGLNRSIEYYREEKKGSKFKRV